MQSINNPPESLLVKPKYQRIILKLSGEALSNNTNNNPIDGALLKKICQQIKDVYRLGVTIGIVVGGGNIFRGFSGENKHGIDRITGDFMGMLATAINGLALTDCLSKMGVPTRLQSAISMDKIAEPFILKRARQHLERKRVVIFVTGVGDPFFSTDTAAALRGNEIDAEIIMKATKVNGIYDKDPVKYKDAVKFDALSFADVQRKRLKVMDATAFSLCEENNLPILVFDLYAPDSITNAVKGEKIGTLVT